MTSVECFVEKVCGEAGELAGWGGFASVWGRYDEDIHGNAGGW